MEQNPLTEALAAQAALQDPAAFADLVARVHGRLQTWIAVRLGPALRGRVTEDDVLQETLLQAYRTLDRFQSNGPGSFRRWLLSVAENRIRDLHKFHAAKKRDFAREAFKPRNDDETAMLNRFSASITSPSLAAGRNEQRADLVAKIDALPEDLRAVVIARALKELPFKEIAQQLGRPLTTVQAQFARGLRALKDTL